MAKYKKDEYMLMINVNKQITDNLSLVNKNINEQVSEVSKRINHLVDESLKPIKEGMPKLTSMLVLYPC